MNVCRRCVATAVPSYLKEIDMPGVANIIWLLLVVIIAIVLLKVLLGVV